MWCSLEWSLKFSAEIWRDWWTHTNCMCFLDAFQLCAVAKCTALAKWFVSVFCFLFLLGKYFIVRFFRSFWYYKREAQNNDNYTFRAILVGWCNSFTRLSKIFPKLVSYLHGYIVANCDFNHTMEVNFGLCFLKFDQKWHYPNFQ